MFPHIKHSDKKHWRFSLIVSSLSLVELRRTLSIASPSHQLLHVAEVTGVTFIQVEQQAGRDNTSTAPPLCGPESLVGNKHRESLLA